MTRECKEKSLLQNEKSVSSQLSAQSNYKQQAVLCQGAYEIFQYLDAAALR